LLVAGLKMVALAVSLAMVAGCVGRDQDTDRPLETVPEVDLKRYGGLWYEVARLPNRFQDHCASDVTAFYEPMDEQRVAVINRCVEADGGVDQAEGIARVLAGYGNARLQVSFVGLLGLQLFWGDYWIIGLPDDYAYAVVGTPSRGYGWILARDPQLPPDRLEEAFSVLREQGYDESAFILTAHDF
jgi:apolipoprotein D and lipocalin family protein